MNHQGFEYEVEGDIDFFNELKQMTAASTAPTASTAPRCLITDEPLRRDHITLQCGHRFNYVPLFKDVLFQKCALLPKNLSASIITTYTKTAPAVVAAAAAQSALPTYQTQNPSVLSVTYNSSYNLETTKLQYNEMKCPYCRTITPHILPYYPYPDVSKVKYVNIPPNLSIPAVSCEYDKYISGVKPVFATNDTTATCKSLCVYNEKYDVMLCNKHFNKLETLAAAAAAARTRAPNPKNNDENVIISHHNQATSVCSFVLLSGARKGCPCEKPMWVPKTDAAPLGGGGQQSFCKAHYAKGVTPTAGI
jgi:hypothetical protein